MEFRKVDFANEKACFRILLKLVRPEGLRCPRCRTEDGILNHRNHTDLWRIKYQCEHCGRVFTAWTGTPFQGTHRPPSEIVRIIAGIVGKESDSEVARELARDRGALALFRHKLERWMNSMPKEAFTKFPTMRKNRDFRY